MERRPSKDTDQQKTEEAFNIMNDCMIAHPEIEPTLWAAAIWSILVQGYVESGVSYEEFTKEWDQVKPHYKHWFNE